MERTRIVDKYSLKYDVMPIKSITFVRERIPSIIVGNMMQPYVEKNKFELAAAVRQLQWCHLN